jgi:hypothetical protein
MGSFVRVPVGPVKKARLYFNPKIREAVRWAILKTEFSPKKQSIVDKIRT